MTPAELRALAGEKENSNRIVKEGYLNQDWYSFDDPLDYDPDDSKSVPVDPGDFPDYMLRVEVEDIKDKFATCFKVAIPKGTKFVCRVYQGVETWSKTDDELEYQDEEFADKYLENIREV